MSGDGYDMDAHADVYIATQGGTRSGEPRRLWRMTVRDAQTVCSHPSTRGAGRGGEWALHWTTHDVEALTNPVSDSQRFAADDGRFADLFAELGVTVLASRALLLSGTALPAYAMPHPRETPPPPLRLQPPPRPGQLALFGAQREAV